MFYFFLRGLPPEIAHFYTSESRNDSYPGYKDWYIKDNECVDMTFPSKVFFYLSIAPLQDTRPTGVI